MRRGFSVVEVMVSCAIFSGLLMLLFLAYRMGASAWKKGDTETELLQNVQLAVDKISRPLEASCAESVTTFSDPTRVAVSFLSPVDTAGNLAVQTGTIRPDWQRYEVFYFDRVEHALFQRTLDLLPLSPQHQSPGPIELFVSPTGAHPLSFYCTDGRPIARHLTDFTVSLVGSVLTFEVECQMKRYGTDRMESQRLRSVTHLRN